MIKKLNPGDTQISASSWNEMRQFINDYEAKQSDSPTAKRNPFLITIKNTTGGSLDPLSVVKIANPTYSRTGDTFANKGIEYGTEMNGSTPGSEDNSVAIIQGACPSGGFIKAIADGCTPAFVYCDDNSHYKFAKPIDNTTAYLKATNDPTNIRILWHASGTGKREAYICLDATGEGDPLRVAATMVNTDERPEGAFRLDTTDTWLYADAINSFAKEDDSNPPAIANPCGYPIDRPVIIGKCIGFQGIQEDGNESENTNSSSSSESENPAPEAVAIACDVREFFVINNGSDTNSSGSSSSSNVTFDPRYQYGNLEYIEYDASDYRWKPVTGSDAYKHRLAVCQRDLPANWTKEYRMPYYTPEQNYGAKPYSANDDSQSSARFTERCGVKPGEHQFSNERLDYHYVNGRYSYEPRFIFIGSAIDGGGKTVKLRIENKLYEVRFPTPRSATSYPDVYAYDQITVEVDASGAEPILTGIDYPMDFEENTIIFTHSGAPGRGWQDVTTEVNSADIGNADLLVWQKNSKIIAEWTTHVCTCQRPVGSGGGGQGHTCEHGKILTAETTGRWYKKIKTEAIL